MQMLQTAATAQLRRATQPGRSCTGTLPSGGRVRGIVGPGEQSRWFRRFRLRNPDAEGWRSLLLIRLSILLLVFDVTAAATAGTPAPAVPEPAAPSTPRECFNAGTQKLGAGKLREAEVLLESALASQDERLQPPALYNLGHVRFGQGLEELKKGPGSAPTLARARTALQLADDAIRSANTTLAGNELEKLVAAYLHGRGVRKELKAATAAVQRALEAHRATLAKWQRASGDFKSVLEFNPADTDARFNDQVVERSIAKLVDSLQELQQCFNGMCDKKGELGEKLKELKGRIPAPDMPPGAAGDDEEDEDQPQGPQPGQTEGASKEGEQMHMSPEQAGWLLDAFKLDTQRRLPMGDQQAAQPKDRARPTW